MKKILSITLIAVFAVVLLSSLTPKKKKSKQFRGIVTYALSYDGEAISEVQKSKLPETRVVKMYDGMMMYDETMGPVIQTTIIKPDIDKVIVLIEAGMKKAALTQKYSDLNNDSTEQYDTQIDLSTDTKIIAGYTCKKAVITYTPKEGVEDEEKMFTIYYSEELSDGSENKDSEYETIPGMLMEFYQVAPGMSLKMSVTEVVTGKVKDLDFYMPDDYKEFTSQEEMIKYLQDQ